MAQYKLPPWQTPKGTHSLKRQRKRRRTPPAVSLIMLTKPSPQPKSSS